MTNGTYVIAVRGVAGPWVRAAFDDVQVSVAGDTTVLRRAGTDQAALHGLLRRIQDLGLDVLDVHLESAEPASGTR
jgi:chitinase